ncbi:MAG TPA: ABC transporter permease [Candidatus Microbacterium stercoravium]|uniref:ABC transporter permease n=1 Tax=Candidatus Microbacterium stercoravium TaxID=2838697 RepID=A0A9D2H6C2_9MICO|nr:ABC transporter permease [Candidatus Microbacterium stercoravium]
MFRYLTRRLINWLVIIVVSTNITYLLAWNFMDPRSNYIGRRPPLSPEQITDLLEPRNLSDTIPLLERWWTWLTNILLHWNWGVAPNGDTVNTQMAARMWVSAEFTGATLVITTIAGIALGVYTANRQYKTADRIGHFTSTITMNIPPIVAALGFVLIAIWINDTVGTSIFYVTGPVGLSSEHWWVPVLDTLHRLILPTLAMSLVGYATTHFLQRALLLDNISADYVRTARAKGLTKRHAIRKHALRTSLIPIATQIAFSIPVIFLGAVLSEMIFAWHGLGEYLVQTIGRNDVHGTVAIAAFGAFLTAIGALLADIAVVALDPRVRVN